MKFTLSWLKTHLDTTATLEQIVTTLTAIGLEVESLHDPAARFAPFKVASVLSAEKHPDADRLRVCIVDTGTEKLQVVCGAPNARAGMKAVFAPAGSVIPSTGATLKKGNIRGQESNGMLVSAAEMGLSDEATGIIEAPADAALGTPLAALYGLDDPVIEINLTPNRADCAGVRGIARDLAAAGLGALKPLNESAVKGSFAAIPVAVDFPANAQDACPLFIGRIIRGVKNGPSPEWLQRRLQAIGLRPISALVDITNYLCHDLCRPLHVFDADTLQGPVSARLARDGETLEALDGKTYTLTRDMTVIADARAAQAIAGVMGGLATACTDATTTVYLECAYFDPLRTARTGRVLQINSDARYRFERGIDPAFTETGTEIATRMILDLCGGEASTTITAGAVPAWQRKIVYDPTYCGKLAGFAVPSIEQEKILKALGFKITGDKDWSIAPPSWRADVEDRADIVEEVLRIRGYDSIVAAPLPKQNSLTQPAETPGLVMARRARQALAARGLQECVTWSFMPAARAEKFNVAGDKGDAASALRLLNPISADLGQMRPSILPNLLDAAARNGTRGFADLALFEVGPAFTSTKIDGGATMAAGVRAGNVGPRHWTGAAAARAADVFDVKADALSVLEACGINVGTLQLTRDAPVWYHPGQSGALRQGQKILAWFGAIHPALVEDFALSGSVAGFEIFLANLPSGKKHGSSARKLLQLSNLQHLSRDFAFIVDRAVAAEELVKAARNADKDLIARAEVFDVYVGTGVAPGQKSIALNVIIQPAQKTLTEAELESLSAKIIAAVTAKTGAQLRG